MNATDEFVGEMGEYVKGIEAKLNTGISTFNKYRFYQGAEAWKEYISKQSNICPKKHSIEIMIDDTNAIVKAFKSPFSGIDARFSVVLDGTPTSNYYETREEAMLAWLGMREEGIGESFSVFAYRALKGKKA